MGLFAFKNDDLGMCTKAKVGYGWLRMIPSGNRQVVEAKCDVLFLRFDLVSSHTKNVALAGIFGLLTKQEYLLHHWK